MQIDIFHLAKCIWIFIRKPKGQIWKALLGACVPLWKYIPSYFPAFDLQLLTISK